jgi:methyl-galactoside transport system permease protein
MFPTMVKPLGMFGLLIPLAASIAVAVVFSMINGFGVAKLHLHAFIVTLGTQLIAYGANCLYIESQPSGTAQALSTFDPTFLNVAAGAFYIGSIRVPLVVIYFIIASAIVWVIWKRRLSLPMMSLSTGSLQKRVATCGSGELMRSSTDPSWP